MKNKRIGRVLDPQWENGMKLSNHGLFRPSFWQRVQIIFGMNILFTSVTFTEHKPGRTAAGLFPRITSATDPKDPRLALVLQIESEKALIAALPSEQQFEAAEAMQERWNQITAELQQAAKNKKNI